MHYVLDFLTDIIGYMTARLLVPLLTFGTVRAEKVLDEEIAYNWAGVGRDAKGRLVMDATVAGWVGLFFWIAVLIVVMTALR